MPYIKPIKAATIQTTIILLTSERPKINSVNNMNPTKITVYIKPVLFLSIILDKNNIDIAQPIPPIAIAAVYSIVVTPTTFVAYVGNIGSKADIEAPCNKIPGNKII